MTDSSATQTIRLSDASVRREIRFELMPDPEARKALADEMGILGVKKLRFTGTLTPRGRQDWQLDAKLGATVVQECSVTLAPVSTRIDEEVTRRYLVEMPEGDLSGEVEMPEDDTAEPLPATLNLGTVMAEALALALPPFPRAEGVELGEAVYAEPGTAPLRDEDTKPFANLAGLRDKLKGDG